jgi:hypothetical protein
MLIMFPLINERILLGAVEERFAIHAIVNLPVSTFNADFSAGIPGIRENVL